MNNITYQPAQDLSAGQYIVILRRVGDIPAGPGMQAPPPQNIAGEEEEINNLFEAAAEPNPAAPLAEGPNAAAPLLGGPNPAGPIAGEEGNGNGNVNNNNGFLIGGKMKKGKSKGTKKMKKAKGTRKLSPYMKFAQEARPKILKENPNMKSDIIGVGRKIGEMWRALSDAEKARY